MGTAIIAGTASMASIPLSKVMDKVGRTPVVLMGMTAFALVNLIFMGFKRETLAKWPIVIPMYILFGLGRATFESTNKAVFADFFPNDADGAFANIILQSGAASTIAFFV